MVAPIGFTNHNFRAVPTNLVREAQLAITKAKLVAVDAEIAAREKSVESRNKIINTYKELITLGKDHIKTLQESKELNNKRIGLLEDTNRKLKALLDGKTPTRSKSAEPIRTPKLEASEIKPSLAKGEILQTQSAKIEDTIKKQDIAIEFKNKEIAKLESNVEKLKNPVLASSSNSVSSPKKEGLSTSYTPSVSYTSRFNESSASIRHELGDFSKFTLEQQRYIAQSQANLFASFATANIKKLI